MTMLPITAAQTRSSYPIAFRLRDMAGDEVLTITDDPGGQLIQLEIHNTARDPIVIPGEDAHGPHFELVFRKGTLLPGTLATVSAKDPGWKIGASDEGDSRQATISLFLQSTTNQVIEAGQTLSVWLQQLRADGGQGARVARVDLRYQNLYYRDDPNPTAPTLFSGSRRTRLLVLNQAGREHVPLQVGFTTPAQILNDGTSNTLTLRITNSSPFPLPLIPRRDEPGAPAPSRLILSFDRGPDVQGLEELQRLDLDDPTNNPWALADPRTTAQVQVNVLGSMSAVWDVPGTPQLGEQGVWAAAYRGDPRGLAAGQSVHVRISNMATMLPPGYSNLYLRYENIPHYWDGQFVCPIERRRQPQSFGRYQVGSVTLSNTSPFSTTIRSEGGRLLLLVTGKAQIQGGGVEPTGPGGGFGGAPGNQQPLSVLVALGGATAATIEIPAAARASQMPFFGKLELSGVRGGEQTLSLLLGPGGGLTINPPSVYIQDLDVFVLQQPS